jgi:site-specific recombinase XerD
MMSVSIRKKRGKLYLDIYENGTRKWEALHLDITDDKDMNKETMRLAEICRAKRALQVVSGEWGLIDPVAGKKTLYSFIKQMDDSGKHGCKIHQVLKHLKEFPGGSTIQIGQINKKWIENFQDYLLTFLSGNSAHMYSGAVRQALRKAVRDNIILKSPGNEIENIKLQETDKVFLSIEEVQKLADTPPLNDLEREIRQSFLFACYTGLRISDLMTITWGDIEHNPLQIVKRQEKTKAKAFIPLSNMAWSIINDGTIHKHTDLVFPMMSLIKRTSRFDRLQKWVTRADLDKHIGWHTARHTFAVLSLESGAEIYTVSKLLGHTSIKTTQIYAKATDKMKREAVNALPEVNIGRA